MTRWGSPLASAVAAYGLGAHGPPLPSRPLTEREWPILLHDACEQRITGHLARALEAGDLAATPEQRRAAYEHHEHALALDLVLERLLLRTVGVLDAAAIPCRVLKGAALAHTIYPAPDLRSFGDVDLLVPAGSFDAAAQVLVDRGARRHSDEPRPGFDRRFGKGVCLETAAGLELDLHRSFVAGPFGIALAADDLFAPGIALRLGGRTVQGLDPELRFLHACFHASLGHAEPRLVPLRDVAQLLLTTAIDAARVRRLCARWRCGIVVRRAVELTGGHLGLAPELAATELGGWARTLEPDAFERRALRAYLGPGRSYARQAVAGLAAVRGVRAKLAYASALLLPEPGYLRSRDRRYRRRWGRAVRLWWEGRAGAPGPRE